MPASADQINAGLALVTAISIGWALRERMTSGELRHRNAQLQTLVSNGRAKLATSETELRAVREVLETRIEAERN